MRASGPRMRAKMAARERQGSTGRQEAWRSGAEAPVEGPLPDRSGHLTDEEFADHAGGGRRVRAGAQTPRRRWWWGQGSVIAA